MSFDKVVVVPSISQIEEIVWERADQACGM